MSNFSYSFEMGAISDHFCTQQCSNVAMPIKKCRRRPKLVPPKIKRFTRARINLNQLWPVLEGDHLELFSSAPLQSSSLLNIQQNHGSSKVINSSSQLLGNDLMNFTLANIENLSNFYHIPLDNERLQLLSNDNIDVVQEPMLSQFNSCSSTENVCNVFENKLSTVSDVIMQDTVSENLGADQFVRESELPMATLDDLVTVLNECEREFITSMEARSFKA